MPISQDSLPSTAFSALKEPDLNSNQRPRKNDTATNGDVGHLGTNFQTMSNGALHEDKLDNDINLTLNNVPAFNRRKVRVITIGAGYSGLTFAYKLRYETPELAGCVENTIYEARSDIGGTWFANTYPGVRCDIPSHMYCFPFDPNPDWEDLYSTGADIHAYMKRTVKKWDLDRDIQLNTRVVGAQWQEEKGQWKVTVEHAGTQREDYCHVLLNAQGLLNHWTWPNIPGLHDFKGHKVHSAAWDSSFDYSGKRIAIIGNGSSAIQILPALARLPDTMVTSFQRNPTWIIPNVNPGGLFEKRTPGELAYYSKEEKQKFRDHPETLHKYRQELTHFYNMNFKAVSSLFPLSFRVVEYRETTGLSM